MEIRESFQEDKRYQEGRNKFKKLDISVFQSLVSGQVEWRILGIVMERRQAGRGRAAAESVQKWKCDGEVQNESGRRNEKLMCLYPVRQIYSLHQVTGSSRNPSGANKLRPSGFVADIDRGLVCSQYTSVQVGFCHQLGQLARIYTCFGYLTPNCGNIVQNPREIWL